MQPGRRAHLAITTRSEAQEIEHFDDSDCDDMKTKAFICVGIYLVEFLGRSHSFYRWVTLSFCGIKFSNGLAPMKKMY